MSESPTTTRRLQRLCGAAAASLPGIAAAHGSDHLHFWGGHTADAQAAVLGAALLALAAIGWWVWRSGR